VRTRHLHQSLVRPVLIMGAERVPMQLAIGVIVLLFAVAWQFVSWPCLVMGLCLILLLPVLQKLAKHDPMMFEVYRRHLWTCLRPHYPARPHALARPWWRPVNFNRRK
jgi:type IV secretory pathway TrbD component